MLGLTINMKRGVYVVALAIGVTIFLIQRMQLMEADRRAAELLEHITSLELQLKNSDLRDPGSAASKPNRELLRLRNEVTLLRQQTNALASAALAPASGSNHTAQASPTPIPADVWTNCGYATPEAALQSTAWAMRTGNLEAYLDSFSPELRQQAADRFKGKSEQEIKVELIKKVAATKALRPDRSRILDDGRIEFVLNSSQFDDGLNQGTSESILRFRYVSGEWKFGE
jgi:hypothetical protein